MAARKVGPVTVAAAGGGTVGAALSDVIVWAYPPAEPIGAALTIILTAALGVLGGWLVKPQKGGDHAAE